MEGYQPGIYRTFTAPVGGVVAGTPLLIGGRVVIPRETVAAGLTFTGFRGPGTVGGLPKAAGVAFVEGAAVRFDSVAGNFAAAIAATNYLVGECANVGGVAGGATTIDVHFDGATHLPNV